MNKSKKDFIDFMLELGVLRFGKFITKSGRETPYFINTGLYNDGEAIDRLGYYYAECIKDNIVEKLATVYGPSYKGIPLSIGTAIAMNSKYGENVHYSFNRKEAKDHGEGGIIVGYTPKDGDNVVIVEDVITSGLSISESVAILNKEAAVNMRGVIISVDRMEKGNGNTSALQEIQEKYNLPVYSIVTIEDVVNYIYNEKNGGKSIVNKEMKSEIEARIFR